jgi:hypothetical protein
MASEFFTDDSLVGDRGIGLRPEIDTGHAGTHGSSST